VKERILSILIVIFAAQCLTFAQSNSWNGLTPLRSTRADVEKLFGAPKRCLSGCEYQTGKETIYVIYARHHCDGGWNVRKDTVIELVLRSSEEGKSFGDLKLDENKFSSTTDDAIFGTWTNPEDGLRYYFRNFREQLLSVNYIPKKSDNQNLRCDGFPPYAPEGRHYTSRVSEFYNQKLSKAGNFNEIVGRFLETFIELGNLEKDRFKGYAVIYFDNKLSYREYQIYLRRIKEYISKNWKEPYEKFTVIEAGLREESRIEFYILPNEWKPPAPEPTLTSPQFMRKK
jgi:hypothetical protein